MAKAAVNPNKCNQIVFMIVNMICMWAGCYQISEDWWIPYLAVMGVLWFVVYNGKTDWKTLPEGCRNPETAPWMIPWIVAGDFVLLVVVNWEWQAFEFSEEYFLFDNWGYFYAPIAISLWILLKSKRLTFWRHFIALELASCGLLLYSLALGGGFSKPVKMYFLLLFFLNLLWAHVVNLTVIVNADTDKLCWLSAGLVILSVFVQLTSTEDLWSYVEELPTTADYIVDLYLSGWNLWIVGGSIFGGAIVLWNYKRANFHSDALILGSIGCVLMAFVAQHSFPSPVGFPGVLLIMAFSYGLLSSEENGKENRNMFDNGIVGGLIEGVLLLDIVWLGEGKWILATVLTVTALSVLNWTSDVNVHGTKCYYWTGAFLGIMTGLNALWYHSDIQIAIMVAMFTGGYLAALRLSFQEHPAVQDYMWTLKPVYLLLFCVLLTGVCRIYSTEVTVKPGMKTNTIVVDVKNEKTSVKGINYKWSTWGEEQSSGTLNQGENTITVEGSTIHIKVMDANGVETRRSYYYPQWYRNMQD